jgi:hypothetical protein
MSYKEAVRFENTANKMSNAASAIYYAISDSIAANEGLSLRVVKREDAHGLMKTILFVEAAVSYHDHDMAFEPDEVSQYYASAMKMRWLEEEGQDAVEAFVEDVLSQLREDTDEDDDREDNPSRADEVRLHRAHETVERIERMPAHLQDTEQLAASKRYLARHDKMNREGNPSNSGLPLGSIALGAVLGAAALHFTMKPKQ